MTVTLEFCTWKEVEDLLKRSLIVCNVSDHDDAFPLGNDIKELFRRHRTYLIDQDGKDIVTGHPPRWVVIQNAFGQFVSSKRDEKGKRVLSGLLNDPENQIFVSSEMPYPPETPGFKVIFVGEGKKPSVEEAYKKLKEELKKS